MVMENKATSGPSLLDLPVEILDKVLPYLDAKDFLAVTATCKQFRHEFLNDLLYWRALTINTFRVRNRPSGEGDGVRWRKIYQRMRTQTRVYLWGQATRGGDTAEAEFGTNGAMDPGIIADLQCGGWCTVLLNERGQLFLQGKLDGEAFNPRGVYHTFAPLKLPDGVSGDKASVRQFSAGRKHVLGLADDGTVWLWYGAAVPAREVTLPNGVDASDIILVIAGWSNSAILIRGGGIEYWNYVCPVLPNGQENPEFENNQAMFVPESNHVSSVPKTMRSQYSGKAITMDSRMTKDVDSPGEVISFILLEHYILFCTDKGHLLAHKPNTQSSELLPGFDHVSDVQGTFQSFAVFNKAGDVITADQTFLDQLFARPNPESHDISRLTRVPALQNSGVIQITFGDYHFHALHANGRITSHGKEPAMCGALGLGRWPGTSFMSARGMLFVPHSIDAQLATQARLSKRGRAVWLYPPQNQFVAALSQAYHTHAALDLQDGDGLDRDTGVISEWLEDMGTRWEGDLDQNGLDAYFALSVAAGGWRGGALMLVDEASLQQRSYSEAELLEKVPDLGQLLRIDNASEQTS